MKSFSGHEVRLRTLLCATIVVAFALPVVDGLLFGGWLHSFDGFTARVVLGALRFAVAIELAARYELRREHRNPQAIDV